MPAYSITGERFYKVRLKNIMKADPMIRMCEIENMGYSFIQGGVINVVLVGRPPVEEPRIPREHPYDAIRFHKAYESSLDEWVQYTFEIMRMIPEALEERIAKDLLHYLLVYFGRI